MTGRASGLATGAEDAFNDESGAQAAPASELRIRRRAGDAQGVRPQFVEPSVNGPDAALVEAVDAPRALSGVGHETSILEDTQVLRHRRPGYRQGAGEFADWARPRGKPLNHLSAGGIAESCEGFQSQRVSHG